MSIQRSWRPVGSAETAAFRCPAEDLSPSAAEKQTPLAGISNSAPPAWVAIAMWLEGGLI
jgi:hypothetical protein